MHGALIGLIVGFVLILIHKWEIHHRFRKFCFFCVGFWLCVLFTILLAFGVTLTVTQLIFIPIVASVIAYKLQ